MTNDLHLESPAFQDQERMPDEFARQGGNASPPLEWSAVPPEAAELMLWCEDPDAPGEPFLHWLVTGISPQTRSVAKGRTPQGAREWPNDFGQAGWGGPQPPVGDQPHHYVFRLCALAQPSQLPRHPHLEEIHDVAAAGQLAGGTLIATYSR
jgi:Raf kinase inhibitor-like YbhB/YbcL family protein